MQSISFRIRGFIRENLVFLIPLIIIFIVVFSTDPRVKKVSSIHISNSKVICSNQVCLEMDGKVICQHFSQKRRIQITFKKIKISQKDIVYIDVDGLCGE